MSPFKLSSEIIFGAGALLGLAAARALRSIRFELQGKTVFITGGSRGLGLLLAHEFASRGARVAISGRDRDALDHAADTLRQAGAEVLPLETDISVREDAELAVDQIHRKLGPVDILVNNAGTICVGAHGSHDHRRLSQFPQHSLLGTIFLHHGCVARDAATQARPHRKHLPDRRKN